jgi:hypothetical protein
MELFNLKQKSGEERIAALNTELLKRVKSWEKVNGSQAVLGRALLEIWESRRSNLTATRKSVLIQLNLLSIC